MNINCDIRQDSKYLQINLKDILNELGEDETKRILSSFSCPINQDVQTFIREKAIVFAQRGFAATHLVYWVSGDDTEKELVGYYTLAPKDLIVKSEHVSRTLFQSIKQYGHCEPHGNICTIPTILIGQLSKNYTDGNDTLISGSDLLYMAIERIKRIQIESGGRYTYLECEDKEKLINFYQTNGFTQFGKRNCDRDETDINGSYLIQLLKKL